MIPLKDDAPRSTTPWVNYFLIAINLVVFAYEVLLPRGANQFLTCQFGFIPVRLAALIEPVGVVRGPCPLFLGRPTLLAAILPILTSMFLHGSWFHVLGNMWFLRIFGDNVEDHLGHFSYLIMYLLSGIGAGLLHFIFNMGSPIPSVGASGAIAGVMGAYFVLYPRARVLTLVPFLFIWFMWLPAWVMLGYWFVIELLSGAATAVAATSQTTGGIAFWAHVGGFIAGIVLIKLFPSRPRRYRYYSWS